MSYAAVQGEMSTVYVDAMRAIFRCIFVEHAARLLILDRAHLQELLQCAPRPLSASS